MIKIGSNFNYEAPLFLDGRQSVNIPENKTYYEVLHDWDISIPDGFEVFCGGKWWTYGINNPVIATGKFRQRTGGGGSGVSLKLTLTSPSGAQLYVPYNSELSSVNVGWDVKYGDDNIVPDSLTILLDNVTYTPPTLSSSGSYLIENVSITPDSTLTVTATFLGENASKTVSFIRSYTKYWGALSQTSLTESDLNSLTKLLNQTSATLTKTFDCTGGKYPYYVMPYTLYTTVQDTLKMYVDGWANTAFSVSQLITSNNETLAVIRHDILQTGVMEIKFTT